jgi:hypothetical protein
MENKERSVVCSTVVSLNMCRLSKRRPASIMQWYLFLTQTPISKPSSHDRISYINYILPLSNPACSFWVVEVFGPEIPEFCLLRR